MHNRKTIKHILICGLLVAILSCEPIPDIYDYKQTTVVAKTTDYYRGSTNYRMAFSDGSDLRVSYGEFSTIDVGDTIFWERQNSWYWYMINKNQMYRYEQIPGN